MDKLERILDLVHVLQSARTPLTLDDLRELFPPYAEGERESTRRKFERDKASLQELGILVTYVGPEEGIEGYRIDLERSYLPPIKLSETERRTLATAARAALSGETFPYRRALRLALSKLSREPLNAPTQHVHFVYGEPPEHEQIVDRLGDALARQRPLKLSYQSSHSEAPTTRRVDPYGVYLRRGAWYLVGHDHLRDALRVFRAARIARCEIVEEGDAVRIPEGFALDAMIERSPRDFTVHEPIEVTIELDPEIGFLMERAWGPVDPASGQVRVSTTNLEFLIQEVLSLGSRARIVAPEDARAQMRAVLRSILEAHQHGREEPST